MTGWSGWGSLGGQLEGGSPVVGRNADGRLEVFALGQTPTGPELSHIWQDAGSPTGWSDWASLGSAPGQFMSALDVGQNADGRLEVFTRVGLMSSGVSWHIWQDPASATAWSGWDNLGSPPGGVGAHLLVVGRNGDGRLERRVGPGTGAGLSREASLHADRPVVSLGLSETVYGPTARSVCSALPLNTIGGLA